MILSNFLKAFKIQSDNIFVIAGFNRDYEWFDTGKYWMIQEWGPYEECVAEPEIPEMILEAEINELFILDSQSVGLDATLAIFVNPPMSYDEDEFWTDDNVNC